MPMRPTWKPRQPASTIGMKSWDILAGTVSCGIAKESGAHAVGVNNCGDVAGYFVHATGKARGFLRIANAGNQNEIKNSVFLTNAPFFIRSRIIYGGPRKISSTPPCAALCATFPPHPACPGSNVYMWFSVMLRTMSFRK